MFDRGFLDAVFNVTRPRPKRKPNPPRVVYWWTILGASYQAPTKSEARALAKKAHGLRRLPAGTKIVRGRDRAA